MSETWGNYGEADTERPLCGYTWTHEVPRDEGHETAAQTALLKARRAQLNRAQLHPVQLSVLACLHCGDVDGRTEAGGLECHNCMERNAEERASLAEYFARLQEREEN